MLSIPLFSERFVNFVCCTIFNFARRAFISIKKPLPPKHIARRALTLNVLRTKRTPRISFSIDMQRLRRILFNFVRRTFISIKNPLPTQHVARRALTLNVLRTKRTPHISFSIACTLGARNMLLYFKRLRSLRKYFATLVV